MDVQVTNNSELGWHDKGFYSTLKECVYTLLVFLWGLHILVWL